jgi:hypothetical protein
MRASTSADRLATQAERPSSPHELRSPSPSTRFPTPIAAKADPMPTHQRFGSNNHENRKDRREPAIELDEEPTLRCRVRGSKTPAAPGGGRLGLAKGHGGAVQSS